MALRTGTDAHARVLYAALSEARQDHWLWRLSKQQLYSDVEIGRLLLILPADVHAKIARGLIAEESRIAAGTPPPIGRIERRIGARDRRV